MWPFKPKLEKRESYTSMIAQLRFIEHQGVAGIATLTATVQTCVSLWEGALSIADVTGTNALTARTLALMARQLALSGEAVFLIEGGKLLPVSDYTIATNGSEPTAYLLTIPDTLGGIMRTALAAEVLHVRTGCDIRAPWQGVSPLKRASLSAGLLDTIEHALADVYADAPLGSQVIPTPEIPDVNAEDLAESFRGKRGRLLLPESVNVGAAGGAAPSSDWRPASLTPDLEKSGVSAAHAAAKNAILAAYGVLPALLQPSAMGPLVREAQRHLSHWVLTPIAKLIAEEASEKLGAAVTLDVESPLHAFDAGGRARALNAVIAAMVAAKAAGIDPKTAADFAGVAVE